MGQGSINSSENREFITSTRWKCLKSPSGAHHWIIGSNEMSCKYCHEIKQIITNRNGWSKPEENRAADKLPADSKPKE